MEISAIKSSRVGWGCCIQGVRKSSERGRLLMRGKKRGKQPRQRTACAKALRQKGRVCWKTASGAGRGAGEAAESRTPQGLPRGGPWPRVRRWSREGFEQGRVVCLSDRRLEGAGGGAPERLLQPSKRWRGSPERWAAVLVRRVGLCLCVKVGQACDRQVTSAAGLVQPPLAEMRGCRGGAGRAMQG